MTELEEKIIDEVEIGIFQSLVGTGRVIDMVGALLMDPRSRVVLGDKILFDLKKKCLSFRIEQKSE